MNCNFGSCERRNEFSKRKRKIRNGKGRLTMAHPRTDDQLNVDQECGDQEPAGWISRRMRGPMILFPPSRSENGQAHDHAEESLGKRGMKRGNPCRQEIEHGDTAEYSLCNDRY